MAYLTLWKKLTPGQLNFAFQAFSLISIFFEGYDQGVMGGVNSSPDYIVRVGIGTPDGTVTKTTVQGGIVSIYYLGALVGCFVGGWLADRIGRVNGMFFGAAFALIGGALQAATQSLDFILVARVVTGIGTGALTGITPVFVSEIAPSEHRGGFLGYVFIANYLGISVAYWLSFGLSFVDGGYSEVRWRFLLAFQCFPALLLLIGVKMLPDTPRYLASYGKFEDAREVLQHTRGRWDGAVEAEYAEICDSARKGERSSPVEFIRILLGKSKTGHAHLGRRAWLAFCLQIMAEWTGITAVTAYSPTLLAQAGYSSTKQGGLAGGINTIGIIGTLLSAQLVDRIGRRRSLMGGALSLFVVNVIAASLFEVTLHDPNSVRSITPATVAMLFLFNLAYAASWGTVAFLIPTEIFPSELRAQGNGFGITGWAVGVGWTTLINPIMFNNIKSRSYFLYAGLNLLWIPVVYLFYPETANRSLESIDALFRPKSPFYKAQERAYRDYAGSMETGKLHHTTNIEEATTLPFRTYVR